MDGQQKFEMIEDLKTTIFFSLEEILKYSDFNDFLNLSMIFNEAFKMVKKKWTKELTKARNKEKSKKARKSL